MALPADLETQSNTFASTSAGEWIWLVQLFRDDTNVVYYALALEDVTFDSQVYAANSMKLDIPKQDPRSTSTFKLTVQNVDKAMINYVRDGDFKNFPIVFIRVHRDFLDTAADKKEWRGTILSSDTDNKNCTLNCGNFSERKTQTPKGTYDRDTCPWPFKSDDCGYSGGETVCNHHIDDCEDVMDNRDRFGGFIGMPVEAP